jgi:L-amino acid N-acyltransferase YncA
VAVARTGTPTDRELGQVAIACSRVPSESGRVMTSIRVRAAEVSAADLIASIYNEGIAGREATSEIEPRNARDLQGWIASVRYPLLVTDFDGRLVGWARLTRYSERAAYTGIAECTIYVASDVRGQGVGTELCKQLAQEASDRGLWKLVAKVFPESLACVRLVARCELHDLLRISTGYLPGIPSSSLNAGGCQQHRSAKPGASCVSRTARIQLLI